MIYLVDDDDIQNLINTKIISLIDPRLEVESFTSVEKALNQLKIDKQPPTIIFVDINMPMITGWDFVREFGQLNLESAVYILSSSVNDHDIQKAKSIPQITDFIRKPLNLDEMKELFSKHELS